MRLEIVLKPDTTKFLLPINYNFPLSAAIYKIFESYAPNFSKWLHDKGFQNRDGKRFKFYTFSRLYFHNKTIQNDIISAEGEVRFFFSSPFDDTLINNFINGLLNLNRFYIGNKTAGTNFKIVRASILPNPKFKNNMKYLMLSPTISSIQQEIDGKKKIIFLNPSDKELPNTLVSNLKNKFTILYERPHDLAINIIPDLDYIESHGGFKNVMKLITIKESTDKEVKLKGFLCPIEIQASPDLQRVAYFCGLGERNSLGFGCLDILP